MFLESVPSIFPDGRRPVIAEQPKSVEKEANIEMNETCSDPDMLIQAWW